MLGLWMLQIANFPTFMGNSLVIDTINVTGPPRPRQGWPLTLLRCCPALELLQRNLQIDFIQSLNCFFKEICNWI